MDRYFEAAERVLRHIRDTQRETISRAAEAMTHTLLHDGIIHLFGSGHAHMAVEEAYPRIGSFVGFHPIIEHSLSYFTNVVGDSGVWQLSLLERFEQLGERIMRNYNFAPQDCLICFSHSGVNGVVVEVARQGKARGMTVIGVTSLTQSKPIPSRHSSGMRLFEVADIVIDTGVPYGDAMVEVPGLEHRVAPGSTLGFVLVVGSLIAEVAERLVRAGKPPLVNVSLNIPGDTTAEAHMEKVFEAYRSRVRARALGGRGVARSGP